MKKRALANGLELTYLGHDCSRSNRHPSLVRCSGLL